METAQAANPKTRDEVFDLAKGVGIIAVVGLHLTSRSARFFHEPQSTGWWALAWINLFLNFCVPLFLLISAILLARSAAKQEKPNWAQFALKRLRSVVLPLIVWSVIYWFLRAVFQHDMALRVPGYWLAIGPRLNDLAFGKAEFHLYFLSILAQLCILLPFVFLLFRRVRLNVWACIFVALAMQTAAYLIHKKVAFPTTTVFWYFSTVIPGIWIGMNWKEWPSIRRATWPVWILLSLAGLGALIYETTLQVQLQTGIPKQNLSPVDGNVLNIAPFIYGLGGPVLVLAMLSLWRTSDPERKKKLESRGILRSFGEMSLQIYLIHPILLELLSKPTFLGMFRALPLPSLWFFLITLFGTYGISLLLERIGVLNPVLFGRDAPHPKTAPERV